MVEEAASAEPGEVEAPRAEQDTRRGELDTKTTKGALWRRIVAVVLAILGIVAVTAAVDAIWLKTTLQDEDQFVSTLQPLPQDDAVAAALSIRVADGVLEASGVEVFVTDRLPDGLAFIAAPLTSSIRDLIADLADDVVQSDAVTTAWTAALRVTHTAVSAVLSGNDRALVAQGGKVAIDLDEIGAVVVERVEAAGLDLPDLDVSLGSIVIYESDELAAAQTVAQTIDTVGWILPLLALLLIAAAIWAAIDRRWMVAFIGFGTAIGLLLSLVGLRISRRAILNGIEEDVARDAAGAVWDTVLARLTQGTWAVLFLALIVGFIAWIVGPSQRARRTKTWGARTIDRWRRPGEEDPSGFSMFLTEWKRTIQVVVVIFGLLFLLLGPAPTGLLVIVVTLVVLGIMVAVEVMAGPEAESDISNR